MTIVTVLEVHAAHACNLACESCSHFSGDHKGVVSLDTLKTWILPWVSKLEPITLRVLGGEPTINPDLPAILRYLKQQWPKAKLELTTNGFFAARHPDLPTALCATQATVNWTIHHDSPEYEEKIRPIRALWDSWRQQYPFELKISRSSRRWTRRYHGSGAAVMPFADNDPSASWQSCMAKFCRQLFLGKLWKCSPLAYLQVQKQTYPTIDAAWDPYLAFKPLDPSCSEQDLAEFLGRTAEAACGMCPAKPERFSKPLPLRYVIRRSS